MKKDYTRSADPPTNGTLSDHRPLWRNPLTVGGSMIASISGFFVIGFFVVDLVTGKRSPYIGLFTFLILPTLLIIGMACAIMGLLVARRRIRIEQGDSALYE